MTKVIELDPEFKEAYFLCGTLQHGILKEPQKGIQNIRKAARLGYKQAQDYLKSRGLDWD
jgi:hypothetical protein